MQIIKATMIKQKVFWMLVGAFIYAIVASLIKMNNSQVREQFKTINTIINMELIQKELAVYNKACGKYPPTLSELQYPKTCNTFQSSNLTEKRFKDYMGEDFHYSSTDFDYKIKSSALSWIEGSSTEKAFNRKLDPE